MTNRERFLACMNFEPVDRLPMLEWATWWDKTVDRWKGEGLAYPQIPGLGDNESLQVYMGLDLHMQQWIGFTTPATPKPAYHGAPIVNDMAEYEAIKPTLYPEHPFNEERMHSIARMQAEGKAVAWITLEGPFWGPRSIMGIEPHL